VRGRGVPQSYKGVAWREGALAYRPLGLEEAKVCALGGREGHCFSILQDTTVSYSIQRS